MKNVGAQTAAVSHDSPRVQTCTLRVPEFKNTTKIQREDPQRESTKSEILVGRGEKRAKAGSGGGGSSEREGSRARVPGRVGSVEEMKKIKKSKQLTNE